MEKDDKIFVNYTWHKGPLGLEIDAQGENDQAEEGVMLLKTPGPPFPTAVTAGMIVKDVNFIPVSDKSLVQVLSIFLKKKNLLFIFVTPSSLFLYLMGKSIILSP